MTKRIFGKFIILLVCAALCASLFSGCALIEHNDEKDARQVIVTIAPITDTRGDKTFTSETKNIYKSELNSSLNSNYDNLVTQQGMTLKAATEYIIESLITNRLLSIEAERLLYFGDIEWGMKEANTVKKNIYATVDAQLETIKADVVADLDETIPETIAPETSETTYPVRETEEADADAKDYLYDTAGNVVYEREGGEYETDSDGNMSYKFADTSAPYKLDADGKRIPVYKQWAPSAADYPARYGDDDEISRDTEALLRFVNQLKEIVASDFLVTADDRAKFKQDDAVFGSITDGSAGKPMYELYPAIAESHYLDYIIGESVRNNVLISLLQEYLLGGVKVTEEEVIQAFANEMATQRASYVTVSNYETAMGASSGTTVVYHPNTDYFYVKHILLQFSEEQSAEYTAIKNKPENDGLDFEYIRDTQFVPNLKVQAHPNGELDPSTETTVGAVFAEIKAKMAALRNNPKEAERKFDDYIYLYNQDSGAFTAEKGYAVKKNDDDNHSGYMEEFYDGAMELYNNYSVGEVLPTYVVTDYGVHIMYYAGDVKKGEVSVRDYLSAAQNSTYYDVFESTLRTTKEEVAYSSWVSERINYYLRKDGIVTKYEKRYKSIYEN